jgi:dihydrofolate synthase/folylpolyglutamate synthase
MTNTGNAPKIRNRDQAEAFVNARIGHGVKPGLERISGLLEFMGSPETAYPSIHVAGTNGKTTVSRMLQQILGAHGLATGGFTSPHLHTIEERFTLHGVTIDPNDFTDAVADIAWFVEAYEQQAGMSTTYFEVTAALAFSIFATATVDVAVVEVGLGGRLDATNVLDSTVAVITGVDIDHTEFLGEELAQIAAEKVAILPDGGLLVTGPLEEEVHGVIAERVSQSSANWIRTDADFSVTTAEVAVGGWLCTIEGVFGTYEDLFLPIHGRHQVDHLATSIAACEMFIGRELDHDSLEAAVASISAPGRLEIIGRRPLVIVDGAHNAQGFRGLADTLMNEFPAVEWNLVLGVRGVRDVEDLVSPLKGIVGAVYATVPDDPAAISAELVAAGASSALGVPTVTCGNAAQAMEMAIAQAGTDGGVVVAGSIYLVGDLRDEHESQAGAASDRAADAHLRFEAERDFDREEEYDDDQIE